MMSHAEMISDAIWKMYGKADTLNAVQLDLSMPTLCTRLRVFACANRD